ncbi:hypothetical protein Zmor_010861 [Zophobas morio]|uniref:acid phosphatase n=1 Tax=Zophobas morio TaxID=2755281 RepID=A0AA38IS60_9CUCU|nr:hypothetical protein Zmor_010861 [Zophobas morio]
MNFNFVLFFGCYFYYLFLSGVEITGAPTESGSLKLLYVIFRHGNRTPNGPEELYPEDPYLNEKYSPIGLGQLTNSGKRREYRIGKALRERYNQFLGQYYTPEIIEPVSTDYNRTKMSLLLVLYSLYPPKGVEIWKWNTDWQPIPYNYLPASEDKFLLGTLCPHYIELYDEYSHSPQVQAKYNKYQNIFNYISRNTGLNITSFRDVYQLRFGLLAEKDWGFELPEWTKPVWPQNMTNLAIREYFIGTGTTNLRRMASGYFLQKMIADIKLKINHTTPNRKIYLNSAHEDNLANLLITLDIFKKPHIPDYGAYLTFEIHLINGKYGIKIYYQNYETDEPRLLKLPACESFCALEKFISLTEEYMPAPDLCYR